MSDTADEKIATLRKGIIAKWAKTAKSIDSLDKDVWHNIKSDANIKKSKWFQSGSAIGPKITKAKSCSTAFSKKPSSSNLLAVHKALTELSKECKGFWAKHKDAPQDKAVTNALKIYDEVATDGAQGVAALAKAVEVLEKADRGNAVDGLMDKMHIN